MPTEIRAGVRRLFSLRLFRRDFAREEMDEELQFHFEARVAQFVARGLPPEAARAEALRRLGGSLAHARHRLQRSAERKTDRMRFQERFDDFRSDIRLALRSLLRHPAFALISVLTLAIGIGANTAIFSAVNALLLRPLPYRQPDRLMDIIEVPAQNPNNPGVTEAPWSFRKFEIFRDAQSSFSHLALWTEQDVSITGTNPERVHIEWVSAQYLPTLGVGVARGTGFDASFDAHGGVPPVTLISDALWRRRFGGDPRAIGQRLDVNGTAYQVIGVLPATFRGLSGRADVLLPIAARTADDLAQPWSLEFSMIGRLRDGVSLAQANADASLAARRVWALTGESPGTLTAGGAGAWGAAARPLDGTRVAPAVRTSLLILFGAVGFVLLIACVNLANLMLGRAATRQQELAVRLAIGAGRGRLVRLLLTETAVIAAVGGALSVFVAWWGTRTLSAINPQEALQSQNLVGLGAAGFDTISLDGRALLFTLLVTVLVATTFGLLPAFRASRQDLTDALKDGGHGASAGGRRLGRSRTALVITEVALALVLLAASGLMIRSLQRILQINTGFQPEHVLTLQMPVSRDQVPFDSMPGFDARILDRLAALPGVTKVGLADCPPLAGGCNGTIMTFPDRPPAPEGQNAIVGVHFVSPGWFGTLGVPLKQGRMFEDADRMGHPKVILISEAAARKYWPGEDPVGKRARIYQGGFHTDSGGMIIGVVGDVMFDTINDTVPQPSVYLPSAQTAPQRRIFFLRTRGEPMALAGAARRAIQEVAPQYPVFGVMSMADRVRTASAQARFSTTLLTLFAAMALALAIMGIYGVMSFAVIRRTREIGIRMALGANEARVLGMVVGEGLRLALIGATLGLMAALALTGVLRSLLFEITPTDTVTYAGILVIIAVAAGLASWIPARRAARVAPTEALRRG